MAKHVMHKLPSLPELKFPIVKCAELRITYDRDGDILSINFGLRRPATSVDVDDELWLRMDPTSGDVSGIEIEDFEALYLKRHPELATIWSEAEGHEQRQLPTEVGGLFVERIVRGLGKLTAQGSTPLSIRFTGL